MIAPRLLILALLATAGPATAGGLSVLFDRTSVGAEGAPPAGKGQRVLWTQRLDPVIGGSELPMPLAWAAGTETVELDGPLTSQLSMALSDLDLAAAAADRLLRRGREAGESLRPIGTPEASGLLLRETRPTGGAGRQRAATVRVLTRGNVRDRWSVRPEVSEPEEGEAPRAVPAPYLLQLDLVSLGLHVRSEDESLPPLFAHLGLRVRLWDLRAGLREWDRALLLGTPLAPDPDPGGRFRAATERLLASAVDRLAAELWPELQLELEEPVLPAAAPEPPPLVVADAEPAPELAAPPTGGRALAVQGRTGANPNELGVLLQQLAERRLNEPPEGEPWSALARALKSEVPDGLAVALACAEDPLGAAVETGSARLGLGVAETYRRIESSEPFRRALAEDLMNQAASAAGEDWPLERAVRYLVSGLAGHAPPPSDAPMVAEPLLRRARLDAARSPESLAALLVGVKVWPEGGQATLRDIVNR